MKRIIFFLWFLGLGFLTWGLFHGGLSFVWSRAASLCLSCMGLE